MPERVHGAVFAEADLLDQTAKATLNVAGGDGSSRFLPREQPGAWPAHPPVGAQLFEQAQRQGHEAVLGSLALANVNDHAGTVDVGDLQVDQFTQTQATAVGDLQQHAVTTGRNGVEQAQNFARAEHARERLGPFAERNER